MKTVSFSSNIQTIHEIECYKNLEAQHKFEIWWQAEHLKKNIETMKAEQNVTLDYSLESKIALFSFPKVKRFLDTRSIVSSMKGRFPILSKRKKADQELFAVGVYS
mmetsp:Transcript_57/g.119  ORF Transcript_57/g.119 Transcript_57/m.119 type:complete len:106 (-) Transcript_57:34-351(-)